MLITYSTIENSKFSTDFDYVVNKLVFISVLNSFGSFCSWMLSILILQKAH